MSLIINRSFLIGNNSHSLSLEEASLEEDENEECCEHPQCLLTS